MATGVMGQHYERLASRCRALTNYDALKLYQSLSREDGLFLNNSREILILALFDILFHNFLTEDLNSCQTFRKAAPAQGRAVRTTRGRG